MNLEKKKVLITGGADGLGYSITKKLLDEGAVVHVLTRYPKKHKDNLEAIKDLSVSVYECDISNYSEVKEIVNKIDSVDILISNVGVWLEGHLVDCSPEQISKAFDTNSKGVVFTTKAVLPGMIERNSGHIFNISSTSGLKWRSEESVYCASKWAVTGFTESLRTEFKDSGIKVTGFYPGGMNTSFFKKAGFPKDNKQWMNTDKVADVIIFMLKQDETMIMDHVVLNKRKVQ
jgi:short-subunit dehydrogenase